MQYEQFNGLFIVSLLLQCSPIYLLPIIYIYVVFISGAWEYNMRQRHSGLSPAFFQDFWHGVFSCHRACIYSGGVLILRSATGA